MALQPTPMPTTPTGPTPPKPGDTVTSGDWGGQNQGLRIRLGLGKPQGYANGTPNVPAPGQTITGGSWTGPDGQTQAPAPAVGQNAGLRLRLGMGKPQGFAAGGIVPAASQEQPALDLSGIAAALAPGAPAPYDENAPTITPLPAGRGFGSLPVAPIAQTPQQAIAAALPGPAVGGQPGGSVPGVPNHAPAIPAGPSLTDYLAVQPTTDGTQVINPAPNGKIAAEPHTVAAIAKLAGTTPEGAHPFIEPHKYTQQEFSDAVSQLPLGVTTKLLGMQHYLTPEQQLIPQVLGAAYHGVDQAKAALDAAMQSGKPAAIEAAKAAHAAQVANYTGLMEKFALHAPYYQANTPSP